MSKPPQAQNDSQSDNGSVNKISDKQKINTLKKAVIELREEKAQLLKTISELTQKNTNLTQEKADLDEKYNSVIRDLQQQIQTLSNGQEKQRNTITSSLGSPRSLIQNDPLNNNSNLTKQIKQLQQELKQKTDDHEAQLSILQTGYKELERDQKYKDHQIDKLTKEIEDKNTTIQQLRKNIEDIEKDLYNRIKDLSGEKLQLQLKLKTIEKEIQQKDEETKVIQKALDDSRFKIAQLLSELEETRGKYLQHKLTLNNQFLDIECLLILRQNLFQEYIFELETSAQRFVYKASDITDLKIKDEQSFYLTIKSRNRDEVFKLSPGQDIKKICKQIKTFLQRAQQSHALQQSSQIQSPKNNGLLGGLISIFGSNSSKNGSNTNSESKQK
ncbi:unnamed protein product (macronuclear) [Paramecium tetraurelia]|uniref:Chromosome undetermined scaffold_1, whole genome shotgun sequence n=1 Tax=Paramecium tetraurelia TaxID=5888 RepID=Q6BFU5_PARTE|nr:hypothetical protein [Paramecium tetraurelia strain d4-2]XP_001423191.1 uncharacterized protein GSPATT00000228001 [Paramecium tetraurelia]CAH03475.1 hypothetical protein, coiled-coil domains [Paramecium tetraurelia]CAK55793.1 unnamed protein product [Paramecium tetraurelia]|eukprot:XP_001423191.1 hypothetical protein (macronuclear) [Paramecium tetraurelia strain d4-2]